MIRKNKQVKILHKNIIEVTDKLQWIMTMKSLDPNHEDRAKAMIQEFNVEFTSFLKVVVTQAQAKHDA